MRGSICGALALVVIYVMPVLGQIPATQTSSGSISKSTAPSRLPYTAEYKWTWVSTRANGSTRTVERTIVEALDSRGRRMTATTYIPEVSYQTSYTEYSVTDPVAQASTWWSTKDLSATVRSWRSQSATSKPCSVGAPTSTIPVALVHPASSTIQDPIADAIEEKQKVRVLTATDQTVSPMIENPMTKVHNEFISIRERMQIELEEKREAAAPKREPRIDEDLGMTTFLGIGVHGHRTTYPAGSISWDSAKSVNERWNAIGPGITGLIVRWIKDDQKFGKQTQELVKFTLGEPDAAIFHPSADYKIESPAEEGQQTLCTQPKPPAQ